MVKKTGNSRKKGTSMVEAAITLPVVVLMTFAMINLAMAGFASVAANNAANIGARVGSVSQSNQLGFAIAAAQAQLNQTNIGEYQIFASGGGTRGSQIIIQIGWQVPNYIGGLLTLLGGPEVTTISGSAQSSFRQEGW